MLQDSWRYSFFALGQGSKAFVNDTIWTVALGAAAGGAAAASPDRVLVRAGVGAAAAVAACVGRCRPGCMPRLTGVGSGCRASRPRPRYLSRTRPAAAPDSCASTGSVSSPGLAAVGYVQAASLLMGPFLVIFMGISLVTVPEATRILHRSPRLCGLLRPCRRGTGDPGAVPGGWFCCSRSRAGSAPAAARQQWQPVYRLVSG